ncbi:MAG: FecR family protein, partial [Thermoanaerobaculia bacterium]|nr:FecR family protein [Thermoanaerobaculia bacterium]
MTDRQRDPIDDREVTSERDAIARLLKIAGPRPRAPLATRERVRRAAHQQWRDDLARRRRRRFAVRGAGLAAMAAALALAFGLVPRAERLEPTVPAVEVATLTAASGVDVSLHGEAGAKRVLRPGDVISSRAWLETGPRTRAAVELVGGGSLRLDRSTRLRFVTEDRVGLESGAIYFDSGPGPRDSAGITVETDWGEVEEIGTQFEVRTSDGLRVRVREGRINLDRQGRVYEAVAGTELLLSPGGSLSRRAVPLFGPEWDWVLEVAEPFGLDG